MRYYKVIAVIDMIESFGDVRLAEGMKNASADGWSDI